MKITLGEETIELNEESLKFQCCFCEEDLAPSPCDPCCLNVVINIDKEQDKMRNQFFWCHLECINNQLAASTSLWSRIKNSIHKLFTAEKISTVKYVCCFCKTNILTSPVDPSAISIMPNDDQENKPPEQYYSCHLACLKKAMLPTMPLYLEDLGYEEENNRN
ncbi:MAG TPA: hypothetical protein VGT41_02005 [Candidatus Babeliales bacterium]|nr:hypothetical protein [Candidatus Babeliales bacterium]